MLGWGVGLLLLELSALAALCALNPSAGLGVLSMVVACHLGGRLAFIGTGFAGGFSSVEIIGITAWHNATMLMLIFPVFLLLSERLDRVPWLAKLRDTVRLRQRLRSRWNLFAIAVFIWVPLPMTGCLVGALLAHVEGYEPKQVLPMALGAMFAGVVCWTLLFEPLYAWMKGIGPHVATFVTLVLILLPVVLNALRPKNSRPRVT
jgi:uncharacterized membrane protein